MIKKFLLQNLEKKYNVEIVIFYDNTLQALQKIENNCYIVVTSACKNIFELKKKLEEKLKGDKNGR